MIEDPNSGIMYSFLVFC